MNNISSTLEFIDFFKNVLSTNNNVVLTEDMIYDKILKMNVPEEQLNVEIDSLFDEWKTKFASFDIKDNNDYLEINNKSLKIPSPLKVYISMDCNHIYKNMNKIINYLSETPFQLRISKYIRNDNVIIRLSSIEDLISLDKYISDNIDDGLFNPNPFTFVYNKLGVTIDGSLSFNNVISNCLYRYLLSKDDYNTIQLDDFYNYIIDLYTNTFITLNNYSSMEIPNVENILFDEKSIVYYKNLLELILKSTEDNFSIKELEKHFNKVNNIKDLAFDKLTYKTYNSILLLKIIYKEQIPNLLDRLYKYVETGEKKYISNNGSSRINIYLNNLKDNINKVLKKNEITLADLFNKLKTYEKEISVNTLTTSKDLQNLIKELSETYDYKTAIDIIQVYLHTNDIAIFTRDNNLREKIINNNLRNNIISILLDKKISFSEYCEKLDDFILEDTTEEKEEVMENTQNYDLDNRFDITSIMVSAIKEEEIDKGYTEQINVDIKEEELEQPTTLIEENTMSVDDLFDEINVEDKTVNIEKTSIEKLFDKMGDNDKETLLNSAIIETYNKYDELFKEGKIKFDGFALVNYALTSILEKDDYTSFTRINEARKNISLLTKQDILDIMCKTLNIENTLVDIVTHDYLQEIIRKYIDYLLAEK